MSTAGAAPGVPVPGAPAPVAAITATLPGHPNPFLVQPAGHVLHSTLREFFDDISQDITTTATREGVDLRLRVQNGAAGVTPADLRSAIFNDPCNRFGILTFVAQDPADLDVPGRFHLYVNATTFSPVIGSVAGPHDGGFFGLGSELVGQNLPTILELPDNTFSQVNGGHMFPTPTIAHLQALVAADEVNVAGGAARTHAYGPFTEDDPGVEMIRCRNAAVIWHEDINFFLQSEHPRHLNEVVTVLVPKIVEEHREAQYGALLSSFVRALPCARLLPRTPSCFRFAGPLLSHRARFSRL